MKPILSFTRISAITAGISRRYSLHGLADSLHVLQDSSGRLLEGLMSRKPSLLDPMKVTSSNRALGHGCR